MNNISFTGPVQAAKLAQDLRAKLSPPRLNTQKTLGYYDGINATDIASKEVQDALSFAKGRIPSFANSYDAFIRSLSQ